MSTFTFKNKSMSAWDAMRQTKDFRNKDIDVQLVLAYSDDPQHETEFAVANWEPGDPSSPVIEKAEPTISSMYVEFHFKGAPIYVTIPAMSTVTIGWLERNDDE